MIRILDKHVADKIAAGEVIDRPVSIIKELLENALDAGATNITVEIRNGGKSYIRVTDNGCGIPSEEAELAFQRHATSKISAAEDLDAIGTLGFRGEALASICAVARVELITKTAESKLGRRLVVEGSSVLENTGTGCPEGTTVTVRDLFYNVPARLKFLASDSAETRRIVDMVSRIALSYGDVKFTLINGKNNVFSTRGNGNILNNIINIYGSDIAKDLLPVTDTKAGFVLKGFVSSPSASAPSRNRQIFCINGRVVSSKVLETALDEAYKEKLFHGRFPVAFLFLAMPPDKLDVNVHPTKKEVRFDDSYEVSDFVRDAVKGALTGKESLPQVRHENLKSNAVKPDQGVQYSFETIKKESTAVEKVLETQPELKNDLKPAGAETRIVKAEKTTIPQQNSSVERITRPAKAVNIETVSKDESVNVKQLLKTLRNEKEKADELEKEFAREIEEKLSPEKPMREPFDFRQLKVMGTVFNTYIMASDADSFYLIDQHAAHERVFYEKLLKQYNESEKLRQQLLMPLQFHVPAQITASEETWLEKIISMGYDISFFGNNTYIVREIPAFMEMSEAEDFLKDFFKELEDKPDLTNRKTLDRIITRSCKSAVKGGDHLEPVEIDALMKDLHNCVNPFSCPHGRPTFIRMTKYEIEKLFKRV